MKTITSRQNPEIMSVAALATSKERKAQGKFLAEGLRVCTTLIKSPIRLAQLYVTEDLVADVEKLVKPSLITIVSTPVMEKISQATTPSGIVGVFYIPAPLDPSTLGAGIVLANIADPGNMGTLIRTCVALSVRTVVIIEGADVWSPKVVQATAGMLGHVNVFSLSFEELLQYKAGHALCALIVQGGAKPSTAHKDALLMIGSEAHGIPANWLASCDQQLTLPMPGMAESLNAAVAGSIALYLTHQ